jgi:aminopeptidase N
LTSAKKPRIEVLKVESPLLGRDTLLLQRAEAIIGFYNRSLGAQDRIQRFTIFLPGTNRDAFALLDNATVITYADFDVAQRGDLLTLAHEISHKWWGYGSVHDESEWLNEAFATYSSLLYLQASGDSTGYQAELAKRVASAANTPAIIGFDPANAPYALFRRVVYDKGTVILAALHRRVGTEKMDAILALTAAGKVSTTAGFLAVVAQVSGPDTRQWLTTELSR